MGQAGGGVRILADENMPANVVERLRDGGHYVEWAGESYKSEQDPNLLRIATRDRRTLVTFDRDFGRLLIRDGAPAPYGVIYFRVTPEVPDDLRDDFIIRVITARESWPPGLWSIHLRHRLQA